MPEPTAEIADHPGILPDTTSRTVEALLFDLGGVVIEIDFDLALRHWATHSALSLAELRRSFCFDAAYQRHERGEIGAAEYFRHLRNTLKLRGTDEQIAAGWNAIFVSEIAETLALVEQARTRFPCHAFTNSNPTHQAAWQPAYPRVLAAFDRVFVSWQLGCRKPELAAFEAVCKALDLPPSAILFFDDTPENVTGAERAGLQAVQVQSPADVRRALARLGCPV